MRILLNSERYGEIASTSSDEVIDIGYSGEYGAKEVIFDLTDFYQYGNGTFVLLHQRSNDFAPYVVQNCYVTEQKQLIWKVNEIDTYYVGVGFAEIQMSIGNEILAKSERMYTQVKETLASATDPSTYTQLTIDAITALAVRAEDAQAAAESAKVAAEYAATFSTHPPIIGDNNNWWLWNGTAYADSGYSCRGKLIDIHNNTELLVWIGTIEEYNALPSLRDDVAYWIKEPS